MSGFREIILGILLLVSRYYRLAAWGIIAYLIPVITANIHVYTYQESYPHRWLVHLIRLPLPRVLMHWAFAYTRR